MAVRQSLSRKTDPKGRDTGVALRQFRGVVANATTTPVDVLLVGASFEEGYGTTLMANGWPMIFRDDLRKYAQPAGIAGGWNYFGFNPYQNTAGGTYTDSPITAATGTFTQPPSLVGLGLRCLRCANAATFTLSFYGTGADLVYTTRTGGGSFSYAVDGGSATVQSTAAAASNGNRVTIRSLAKGQHTIVVIITAAGSDTFGVDFEGAAFYNGDEAGGLRVWQGARAGYTAQTFATTTTWANSIQTWNFPSLCIVNLGFNDWSSGRTRAQIKADVNTIISTVTSRCTALSKPTPSFVLMSSFTVQPTGGTPVTTWPDIVSAFYEIAALNDAVAIYDYQDYFGAASDTSVSTRGGLLYTDGLHPTDSGAAAIGGSVANFVLDGTERLRQVVDLDSKQSLGGIKTFTSKPTFNAGLDVNSQKITGLATPTLTTDAATKAYVDSAVSGVTAVGQQLAVATRLTTMALTNTTLFSTAAASLIGSFSITVTGTGRPIQIEFRCPYFTNSSSANVNASFWFVRTTPATGGTTAPFDLAVVQAQGTVGSCVYLSSTQSLTSGTTYKFEVGASTGASNTLTLQAGAIGTWLADWPMYLTATQR